ncbi:uncharacterized protein BDZ99DRAFT_476708 [Mytilinidion resinicola]|uniref:Uncharacterized protein n=1 Tax=Mytilinidion resinicola TaxID=574789 RepID=A0A6A6YP55_9PEZI|nr:uncharacterized protein BDZ99DRAFT_476708 [Mytilinidion resinicola]KAF2810560.1 hypothetical protein BDZ99DRAFT_476708 [Mytilinidion resinicola]
MAGAHDGQRHVGRAIQSALDATLDAGQTPLRYPVLPLCTRSIGLREKGCRPAGMRSRHEEAQARKPPGPHLTVSDHGREMESPGQSKDSENYRGRLRFAPTIAGDVQ